MAAWEGIAAPCVATTAMVEELPTRSAAVSSLEALRKMCEGGAEAEAGASILEQLAAAPGAATEALPAAVAAVLGAGHVPAWMVAGVPAGDLLGQWEPVQCAGTALAAAAARAGAAPVAPLQLAAVLRVAPPDSCAHRELQAARARYLGEDPGWTVPRMTAEARAAAEAAFAGRVAAAKAEFDDEECLAFVLLDALVANLVSLEPLDHLAPLQAIRSHLASGRDAPIRVVAALGPGTSRGVVELGRMLAGAAGQHLVGAGTCSVMHMFAVAQQLSVLGDDGADAARHLFRGVCVCTTSDNQALRPYKQWQQADSVINEGRQLAKHSAGGARLFGLTQVTGVLLLCCALDDSTLRALDLGYRTATSVTVTASLKRVESLAQLLRVFSTPESREAALRVLAILDRLPDALWARRGTEVLAFLHHFLRASKLPTESKVAFAHLLVDSDMAAMWRLNGVIGHPHLLDERMMQVHIMCEACRELAGEEWRPAPPAAVDGEEPLEWDPPPAASPERSEIFGGHDPPDHIWQYAPADVQALGNLPAHELQPREYALIDMVCCEHPRLYNMQHAMEAGLFPTTYDGQADLADAVVKEAALKSYVRYAYAAVHSMCYGSLTVSSQDAVFMPAGLRGLYARHAAGREADYFVESDDEGGLALVSVPDSAICGLPDEELCHAAWHPALRDRWTRAALAIADAGESDIVKAVRGARPASSVPASSVAVSASAGRARLSAPSARAGRGGSVSGRAATQYRVSAGGARASTRATASTGGTQARAADAAAATAVAGLPAAQPGPSVRVGPGAARRSAAVRPSDSDGAMRGVHQWAAERQSGRRGGGTEPLVGTATGAEDDPAADLPARGPGAGGALPADPAAPLPAPAADAGRAGSSAARPSPLASLYTGGGARAAALVADWAAGGGPGRGASGGAASTDDPGPIPAGVAMASVERAPLAGRMAQRRATSGGTGPRPAARTVLPVASRDPPAAAQPSPPSRLRGQAAFVNALETAMQSVAIYARMVDADTSAGDLARAALQLVWRSTEEIARSGGLSLAAIQAALGGFAPGVPAAQQFGMIEGGLCTTLLENGIVELTGQEVLEDAWQAASDDMVALAASDALRHGVAYELPARVLGDVDGVAARRDGAADAGVGGGGRGRVPLDPANGRHHPTTHKRAASDRDTTAAASKRVCHGRLGGGRG